MIGSEESKDSEFASILLQINPANNAIGEKKPAPKENKDILIVKLTKDAKGDIGINVAESNNQLIVNHVFMEGDVNEITERMKIKRGMRMLSINGIRISPVSIAAAVEIINSIHAKSMDVCFSTSCVPLPKSSSKRKERENAPLPQAQMRDEKRLRSDAETFLMQKQHSFDNTLRYVINDIYHQVPMRHPETLQMIPGRTHASCALEKSHANKKAIASQRRTLVSLRVALDSQKKLIAHQQRELEAQKEALRNLMTIVSKILPGKVGQ